MLKNMNNEVKDKKVIISTLWIVVMLNMIFADILAFFIPGALTEVMTGYAEGVTLSGELMLIAAIFIEIPIIMIFLSRILKRKTSRILNIIAAIITIIFVVGGGSLEPHYLFLATIEVISMLSIIVIAWKWSE